MKDADSIWDELDDDAYTRWGLVENPFSENAGPVSGAVLQKVFTGRERELRAVLSLFKGRGRKRIFLYGWLGIGKTAFIQEVLDVLYRKQQETLIAFLSLPSNIDLATAAFVALAREMPDDEWAQEQLHLMGLPTSKPQVKKKKGGRVDLKLYQSNSEEENIPSNKLQIPALSFESLVDRALETYTRVVIAIDDLDKQDPDQVRKLLHDAQGTLKGKAWFILTGHPSGLARETLTIERGLFDLVLKLEELDQDTTYKMLVNYLNSARTDTTYAFEDPRAVAPFTPETARMICLKSGGSPRHLNRLAFYVLQRAVELQANSITPVVLEEGFAYADEQLRGQSDLSPEEQFILELAQELQVLSDENVPLEKLEQIQKLSFREILPILDKLVQLDFLKRLSSGKEIVYTPSPLLLAKNPEPDQP